MNKLHLQNEISEALSQGDMENAFGLLDTYDNEFPRDLFFYLASSDALLFFSDFETIIALMEDAIEQGFDNAMIYERLGDAYFDLAMYQPALDNYLKCDLATPDKDTLHVSYSIANCYEELGDFNSAINYYEDVLLEYEDHIPSLLGCGICYLYAGKKERGIEYLDQCVALDKNTLENISFELIEFDDKDVFLRYLNQMKDNPLYYRFASDHFYAKGENALALALFRKFAELKPFLHNKAHLAQLYDLNDKPEEAKKIYKAILRSEDDSEFLYDSIDAHLEAYLYLDSLDYLDYVSSHFEDCEAYTAIFLRVFRFSMDVLDGFLMDTLMAMDHSDFTTAEWDRYNEILAMYYVGSEQFEEAVDLLNELDPDTVTGYYYLYISASFNLEDYQTVVDYYDRAEPNGFLAYMCYLSLVYLHRTAEGDRVLYDFLKYMTENPGTPGSDFFMDFLEQFFAYIDSKGE